MAITAASSPALALDTPRAADHYVVGARVAPIGNDFPRKRAEPPLHSVADDRLADLPADGEADALRLIAVFAIADEKDEARHRRAPSGVRGKKVRAFPKGD